MPSIWKDLKRHPKERNYSLLPTPLAHFLYMYKCILSFFPLSLNDLLKFSSRLWWEQWMASSYWLGHNTQTQPSLILGFVPLDPNQVILPHHKWDQARYRILGSADYGSTPKVDSIVQASPYNGHRPIKSRRGPKGTHGPSSFLAYSGALGIDLTGETVFINSQFITC